MIYIFVLSIFVLFYVYFLYPFFIYVVSRFFNDRVDGFCEDKSDYERSIVIVVPAHNEENVISKKLENHLALGEYYINYKILVVCDTCTDKTSDIVRDFISSYPDRIDIFEVSDGLGKTNAINKALVDVECDVLVFSDANVYLKPNALHRINLSYISTKVGGVAGTLIYTNSDLEGAAHSNGLYWQYEEFIKNAESLTGSIMGADGSIFSIRRDLYRSLPTFVLDDFCSSMGVVTQGYLLKFDNSIVAYEKGAESTSEEFSRKIRISNRSYNSFIYMRREFLSEMSLFDILKLYSHKVLRWYSLLFMISAFLSNVFLAIQFDNVLFYILLFLHFMFYFLAGLSWVDLSPRNAFLAKISNVFQYFLMANLAAGIGVIQSLKGKKTVVWKKASSSR